MKKILLTLSVTAMTMLASAQQNPEPVITKSNIVENIPNHSQGFLVLKPQSNVFQWRVQVLNHVVDGEWVETPEMVTQYQSAKGLDYMSIDPLYFKDNNYSFRIMGYDDNEILTVQEDHIQAHIGEPTFELEDCNLRCNGSDYAWRLKVLGQINGGGERLQLDHGYASLGDNQGTAPTPFYEYIAIADQTYFEQQAAERNVDLTNFNSNEWDQHPPSGTPYPRDKNNTPISTGYYTLKKDLGKWRPYVGSSTGTLTPSGGSFCSYQMSTLSQTFNSYSVDAPFYETVYLPTGPVQQAIPLGCDGSALTGNEPSGGVSPGTLQGTVGTQPVFDDFVPCENGQQPFSHQVVYNEETGETTISVVWDWQGYLAFLEDCFNNNVFLADPSDEPIYPGVNTIEIRPVSVDATVAPDPITYVPGGNNSSASPSTLPVGLYFTRRHYGNGLTFTSYTEISDTPAPPASKSLSTTTNSIETSLVPNPANSSVRVQFGDVQSGVVSVLSTDGRVLQMVDFDKQSNVILDIQDIPSGLYWVKIDNGSTMTTQKLIKQ